MFYSNAYKAFKQNPDSLHNTLEYSHFRIHPNSPKTSYAMSYYKTSPNSSHDGLQSMDATPDTKLTAFSPDDVRSIKIPSASRSADTSTESCHNDPFVSAGSKPKAEQKLSATASTFQPFGLKNVGLAPISSTPVPGTADHLHAIIAADADVVRDPITSEVLGAGKFTTDTLASRSIKVESIFKNDISKLVESSLEVNAPFPLPAELLHANYSFL